MLQKGCYSVKIKSAKNLSNGRSAKVYTLEIYPLYGSYWGIELEEGEL